MHRLASSALFLIVNYFASAEFSIRSFTARSFLADAKAEYRFTFSGLAFIRIKAGS